MARRFLPVRPLANKLGPRLQIVSMCMVLAGGVLQQREWRIIPAIRSASGGGPDHAFGERIWIGVRVLLVGFVKALKILLDQDPHP